MDLLLKVIVESEARSDWKIPELISDYIENRIKNGRHFNQVYQKLLNEWEGSQMMISEYLENKLK